MSDRHGWEDQHAAFRFRDIIKRIVEMQVNQMRPDLRIGRVFSYDDTTLIAQVLFVGHTIDELVPVRYGENMMPSRSMDENFDTEGYSASGNVVRVAGSGANLFITDYVTGAPRSNVVFEANYEPPIAAGTATQYWRGDKVWATLDVAAVTGAADDNLVLHKAGNEIITGDKLFNTPVRMLQQGSTPAAPSAGEARIYVRDGRARLRTVGGDIGLAFAAEASTLVANGDFETAAGTPPEPTSWNDFWSNGGASVEQDTTVFVTGTASAKYILPVGSNVAYQSASFAVTGNSILTVEAFLMGDVAGSTSMNFDAQFSGDGADPSFFQANTQSVSAAPSGTLPTSGSFLSYTRQFAVPYGMTKCRLIFRGLNNAGSGSRNIWIDSVSARLETPTTVNTWAKEPVRAVLTATTTLTGTMTIDGVSIVNGDRVLYAPSTSSAAAGIYICNSTGAWTRAEDADTAGEIAGAVVMVLSGTLNGGTKWTTAFKSTDTLGTTVMKWWPLTRESDQDWTNMTLINGWLHYDSGIAAGTGGGRNARYMKVDGWVELDGVIRSGAIPSNFFQMPVGYRHADRLAAGDGIITVSSNNAYGNIVNTGTGNLQVSVGSNVWVSLAGVRYRAEA